MSAETHDKTTKRTFWAVAIFYMIIVFEFFYMASPFGIYFYSVYRPGLSFFNEHPTAAWVVSFFLPHIVEKTSSNLINLHNAFGAVLTVFGFVTFCAGAGHVYYYKLRRKGAVTGGIYKYIRHPQYASLIICSFGLLLLWPRYIVLIMFTTMLFAYFLLAKTEENECEVKYGQSYQDYKTRTNMFLPFRIPFTDKIPAMPKPRLGKFLLIITLYTVTIGISISLARGLQVLSLRSLYTLYSNDSVYLSVTRVDQDRLENIKKIVLSNNVVQTRLEKARDSNHTKFLNYVLPADRYISEIPMNHVENSNSNHFLSLSPPEKILFKVIFTKAGLRTDTPVIEKNLLLNIVRRTPIMEVRLDLSKQKVISIMEPPEHIMYENIPVPIY